MRCDAFSSLMTIQSDQHIYFYIYYIGAQIRNAGDCIAQAAASCRFKTGTELVTDELREAATCLGEASDKLRLAVDEANADENEHLAILLGV